MSRFILLLICGFLSLPAVAQTSGNRSFLQNQNNTTITTNGEGQITGAILNSLLGNMIASTGTLSDYNSYSNTQTYAVNPVLVSCTGYLYGNATAPASCNSTIPGSAISGIVIPFPTPTNLGGVFSSTAPSGTYATGINTSGAVTYGYAFPPSVPTIAALRILAVSGLVAGQQIPIEGYSTNNDGGGGTFTVALSNVTDDGGCVINSTVGVASFTRNACFQGNPISLLFYGGNGNNSTDNTASFNEWSTALGSGTLGKSACGYIPTGTYIFLSQPNDITFILCAKGDGLNSTVLVRDFNLGSGSYIGLLNYKVNSSGSLLSDMAVEAASGVTGGSLIQVLAPSGYAPSIVLRNLWVTTKGSNTNDYTIVLDGRLNTTGAIGIRDTLFENVHAFGCNIGPCVELLGVVGFTWSGGGIYGAGGTGAQTGQLQISGVTAVKSQYVNINLPTVNDGMTFSHSLDVILNIGEIGATGGISIANDSTASLYSVHSPDIQGTVDGNWVNSTSGP